ncbi:cytoplasmic dynein 2 light intermediate chain 1-like [Amphibalanus amphitrite]|uniref:cytoplasmic dynein 2 light intermediate chain 1-like n=1 Tax=Amphibalanus amphitrite TaxID=1232801 RepID=UPI001C8FB4C5|nr:cytoplasmic dynein 2 light intermediate chain 1-like [Amphibalanus amphitrite]XP_043243206.1 cytoplasmic dynein 2 light intermediate chain 1-like [Amphibalanus amphitrite]
MDMTRGTPMPPAEPDPAMDDLTEEAILNEQNMTEVPGSDENIPQPTASPVEPEYPSRPSGDGEDITDSTHPADGIQPASVRGSMASLRSNQGGPRSSVGDIADPGVSSSMASLREDPHAAGDSHSMRGGKVSLRGDPSAPASIRGSTISIRGDQTAADSIRDSTTCLRGDPPESASVRGSTVSLRGDPTEPASVRGSTVSLRGDPAAPGSVRGSTASLRGDPSALASVRGSTVSLRGSGDKPAAPLSRPPTSRPPPSAVGARTADSAIRANKMALKNKKNSEDTENNKLTEEAEEEFQGDNIWVIAEKMNQARILRGLELTESHSVESTLLFVGGKQAGKSRLIHKFLDRDEEPKKTLGLEYSYGRKTGKSVLKDVCHIWELGGGTTYTPLLETPLKAERLPNLSILLVVDLTKPQTMWATLETMIKTLRDVLDSEISSGIGRQMQLQERLKKATEQRVPSDHPDAAHVKPFPVPLVLVGGHYDVFQDWDPEKKKLICRSLRYLAHVNGASLYFFSSQDSALVKKAKDMMNQMAFGGPASGYLAQDYNKPLLVPAGTDSLAGILGVGADPSYNTAKNTFTAQYPQDSQGAGALPDDPAKDMSYREPEIDQLRSQKDQELERLRRELERRRRWGDEL